MMRFCEEKNGVLKIQDLLLTCTNARDVLVADASESIFSSYERCAENRGVYMQLQWAPGWNIVLDSRVALSSVRQDAAFFVSPNRQIMR